VKRAPKRASPTKSARRKSALPSNVIDFQTAVVGHLTKQIIPLVEGIRAQLDEQVGALLALYRAWERENPHDALRGYERIEMVRFGFVGSAGFVKCHEPERMPAFYLSDLEDEEHAEYVMCPAKERGNCKPIWSALGLPPCVLLLLEVHQGLGGKADDLGIHAAVSSFGRWHPGPEHSRGFVAAARLVRKARKEEAKADAKEFGDRSNAQDDGERT